MTQLIRLHHFDGRRVRRGAFAASAGYRVDIAICRHCGHSLDYVNWAKRARCIERELTAEDHVSIVRRGHVGFVSSAGAAGALPTFKKEPDDAA